MELQAGLNNVVKERIERRIQKGGVNATAAVERLINEGKVSKDFIAYLGANGQRESQVNFSSNGHVKMHLPMVKNEEGVYQIHDNAIGQLGEKFKVPTRYLKDLSAGDEWQRNLAAEILNKHSQWTPKTRALVRSVGNEVRGVMSDSYRRLNSQDIVMAFIEAANREGAELADGFMDATRLYMEVLMPQTLQIPTEKNGIIEMAFGARLSTSDYGDGALELRAFMMQGICLNGMVRDSIMRQIHFGGRLPEDIQLSERTYRLDTRTQASTLRDLTKGIFDKDHLMRRAIEIQTAAGQIVDMEKELKGLQKSKITKEESEGVSQILMRNNPDDGVQGESTLWKLIQGITAKGRDLEPRRQRDFQEIAGELMKRAELKLKV